MPPRGELGPKSHSQGLCWVTTAQWHQQQVQGEIWDTKFSFHPIPLAGDAPCASGSRTAALPGWKKGEKMWKWGKKVEMVAV